MKDILKTFIQSLLIVIAVVIALGLPLALATIFCNGWYLLLWILSFAIYITVLRKVL